MTDYFECLQCGALSRVVFTLRPVCPECGCGTGFIRSRDSDELPSRDSARNPKAADKAAAPKRG